MNTHPFVPSPVLLFELEQFWCVIRGRRRLGGGIKIRYLARRQPESYILVGLYVTMKMICITLVIFKWDRKLTKKLALIPKTMSNQFLKNSETTLKNWEKVFFDTNNLKEWCAQSFKDWKVISVLRWFMPPPHTDTTRNVLPLFCVGITSQLGKNNQFKNFMLRKISWKSFSTKFCICKYVSTPASPLLLFFQSSSEWNFSLHFYWKKIAFLLIKNNVRFCRK